VLAVVAVWYAAAQRDAEDRDAAEALVPVLRSAALSGGAAAGGEWAAVVPSASAVVPADGGADAGEWCAEWVLAGGSGGSCGRRSRS
jgi:hypothetical protein